MFYSEFDDFQTASFLGLSFLVRNAEEVSSSGLEVDNVALLTSWLTADFAYTYLDTQYENFTEGACHIGWRNDSFDIAAWAMNATDEDVVTLSGPQTLFGSIDGGRQIYLNDPKTYGITVRYTY